MITPLDVAGETGLNFERVKAIVLNDADRIGDTGAPIEHANIAGPTGRVAGHREFDHEPGHKD